MVNALDFVAKGTVLSEPPNQCSVFARFIRLLQSIQMIQMSSSVVVELTYGRLIFRPNDLTPISLVLQ